jgi:hypothetical protein
MRSVEQEAERARRFGGRPNFEPRPPVTTPTPCGLWPIKGGNVCHKHGVNRQAKAFAARTVATVKLQAEVAQDLARLGYAIPVEDGESIKAMRDEAAANVAVLRRRVHDLTLDATTTEVAGIYGYTFHITGQPTGEGRPHVLVTMYWEACDRLAKLDEMCIKLGLRAREVQLAEDTRTQIAVLIEAVLRRAGLDPLAAEVRSWVYSEMQALSA